jgi:glycosyltransferase involved in cell wall biosynthesis
MLLGKPVVATDYSATTEFLTADVGLPVRYHMVPVGPDQPPYPPDAVWAEPDERHAADRLRWAFEHPEEARWLGDRAKRHAEVALSPEAAGRRMADRLRTILARRGGEA